MSWVAVDSDKREFIYTHKPVRVLKYKSWYNRVNYGKHINIPKGTIEKLTGRQLTWLDECVKLKATK